MSNTSVSISLPDELVALVEQKRKQEHRSRSEIVQEALRQYLGIVEPAIPDWHKELVLAELEAFRRDPDQETYSPDEVIAGLRASRARKAS